MKKYLATFAIFLTLGISNVGAQDQQNDPQYAQPQQPNSQANGQYPADSAPQSGTQSYPYPSGPYPGANPSDQTPSGANQPPENQGAPQNGQPYPYPSGPYPGANQPPDQQGNPGQSAPQAGPQSGQPSDAQQPGAARISFIHGDVSTQRGDNGDWEATTINTPVVTGDRIATGNDSRTEVQLDYADVLRMSSDSTANVANLTRSNIQVQIGQGLVDYSVLKGAEASAEIDTPNAAVRPDKEGDYRILVNSNSETQVIVRNGSADISTPQGSTHVDRGQMITVSGTDNPQYRVDRAPGADEWDSWNGDRDRVISNAASWNHTDRYYTGTQDLDNNGTWSEIPDYGPVWTPAVAPGWAPYRAGRWIYEPYYGWTWVSYEPWGWAPYHYGRWFVYGSNWVWWPGPVAAYPGYYPIWAPAYVSFFGFGGGGFGIGFGFGFGSIGWLPCGPGDWFHPWYGRWGGRYGLVNVRNFGVNNFHEGFDPLGRGRQNFSNVGEALRNDRVRGGVSSMAGNEFGRGAVPAHQERISDATFRQGSMMTGRMPVTPTRASFSPTNRTASASAMHAASISSQHFYSPTRSGASAFGNNAGRTQPGFGVNRNNAFERQGAISNRNANTVGQPNSRGAENSSTRGAYSATQRETGATGNQGGWQHFTPSSGRSQSETYNRSYSSGAARGENYGSYSNSARPTLNMRQPIVTQRSESSSGSYNRSYESRSYSSGAGNSRAGESRSYSAPSGGGHRGGGGSSNHGGGGGGSHGGGGHSSSSRSR